ncbi:MAG: FHA domain-containing protein [candidate division Zixibacteria bacterium]|nr:FHA domain-containing protein [candidate division Zixibacteria bacterium]MDH3937695.1 FHA domain-containing protein [candidate division Zixibacteria bacterium]
MPEITVKYEDKVIERIVTEKKRISIGRGNDNDIVLENRGVSRRHAMIEFNDNAAVLIDNESLNGTFVNSRKVSEEVLRDQDVITIGKYALVYNTETTHEGADGANFDGTMVLNTKQQKKMLENDKIERQIVEKYGGSVLLGMENADFAEHRLDRDVSTIGKAKFVHVRAKGFWLSGIQAKIVIEGQVFSIYNLGKQGKLKVNGEPTTQCVLKNGDLISVGKSTFKFVESKS